MKSAKKHTFYPIDEVESELKDIPRGQLSERVNELILKGLSFERRQDIALAYQQYDTALAQESKESVRSSSSFMSEGAFESEDEVEDFA